MFKSRYIPILILALALLGIGLLAFPAIIRALPGRYAYYLPEPLQALRHNPHPVTLPTPARTQPPAPTVAPTTAVVPTTSPTAAPSPTPTHLPPTSTPVPVPTPTQPVTFKLTGVRHEHQGWNNCGPTTLTMALSYWGREENQHAAAPVLKPDPEDKDRKSVV